MPNASVSIRRPLFAILTAALLAAFGLLLGCGVAVTPATNSGQSGTAPTNLIYSQTTISAAVGVAISADTPLVTGTVTSYTISPSLPAGLSLNSSTGIISGSPTATSAQASYTVTASNSYGSTTETLLIAVGTAPSNLLYPQTIISATVGVAISVDTPAVSGSVDAFTISPTLPAGLFIVASTGAIAGTPTAVSAQTSYTVTATNSYGSTTATLYISVASAAPSNLTYPQNVITSIVGVAISADTPVVTGTVTSYTINPSLPAGLSINSTTGTIAGTPTAASAQTSYIVTASNSYGSAKETLLISVGGPPANLVYPQTTITATAGVAMPIDTPTVSNTVNSFSISPALPTGLSINTTTGMIAGTPTAVSAQASYTVTATNSYGSTTATLLVSVVPGPPPTNLVYPASPLVTYYLQYASDTPTVSGAQITFTISPALPSGLNLSTSNGAIWGTPTVFSAQTSYTVTATNPFGSTSTTILVSVVNMAPANLYYGQTTINATLGFAITAETPSASYYPTAYSITPALPTGLSIDPTVGTLSGIPLAVSPLTAYTVTASNSGGSTSITLHISVTGPSNGITYPQTAMTAYVGQPIITDIPAVVGSITAFSISPTLPAGLGFDTTTGAIYGTPTAVSAQTSYTVTAVGSSGTFTASIQLAVSNATTLLLDLGETESISLLRSQGTRVLSQDATGHWVYWNSSTGAQLAEGDANYPADLAGASLVTGTANGLEIRSTTDGHILSFLASSLLDPTPNTFAAWWKLSTDGSYICAGSKLGLSVWSISGALLASRSGNYASANVYAAPGQLQIALGAAGTNVIETISTSTGLSTISPAFQGTFSSWFIDGSSFLSNGTSSNLWTYSNSAVQEALISLSGVEYGMGNWLVTYTYSGSTPATAGYYVTFYLIGSTTPSASYFYRYEQILVPSLSTMSVAVMPQYELGPSTINVFNLSGPIISSTSYSTNMGYLWDNAAFSNSQWVTGNEYGQIEVDSTPSTTPVYLGAGAAYWIAGGTNRVAVSTASSNIYIFNPAVASVQSVINAPASMMSMSLDDTRLAVSNTSSVYGYAVIAGNVANPLTVYSLPSGSVLYTVGSTYPSDFAMSSSGTMLDTQMINNNTVACTDTVTDITGTQIIESLSGGWHCGPPQLSPDGTQFAETFETYQGGPYVANVYKNGLLTTGISIPGYVVGWINNSYLLVDTYSMSGRYPYYSGAAIYDGNGNLISTVPNLATMTFTLPINSTSFYDPANNTVYSTSTGAALWTGSQPVSGVGSSSAPGIGAIAGSYAVYVSGHRVLSEVY